MALIKQTSHDKVTELLEEILDRDNMFNALNRVEKNKGCPGIDNLSTSELRLYLKENWIQIKESILLGTYKLKPAKYVLIPKADGKKRQLGIPTVIDRLIQQAILQKLTLIFDPLFSKHNFGFRTRKISS